MRTQRIMISALSSLILVLFVAAFQLELAQPQAPKGKPVSIRGKISAVEKQALKVTTSAGEVLVKLPDDVRIGGVETAQLSDIEAGKYVGTTAVKQADGNLKALEVHIFPESSRGTGEGHRPWDLQPGSTMTNANVEKVEQVAVEKIQGQMITLKYKDGEQKVFIPPGTPIVRNVPGDRSLLKPGTGSTFPRYGVRTELLRPPALPPTLAASCHRCKAERRLIKEFIG